MARTRSCTALDHVSAIADMGLPPLDQGRECAILRLLGARGSSKLAARRSGYGAPRDEKNRVELNAVDFGNGGADTGDKRGSTAVQIDLARVDLGRDADT